MAKAAAEYYNLEKVAEVLSVSAAEVNRLREQGKLRGLRDGSTWKFFKEEVHTYLAESIKARSGSANGGHQPGESDFDLGESGASASSFDLLMEDAALPGDSDLVSVAPVRPSSDLDLAALDQDDELALAEETQISSLVVPKKAKPKEAIPPPKEREGSVVQDIEDSSAPILSPMDDDDDSSALILAPTDSDVLVDEASVLSASGSSPQLNLAGDSGFDVLIAAEDDSALIVDDEKTDVVALPVQEFELEPLLKTPGDDSESESSSQVIAIDTFMESEAGSGPFGQQEDGFGGMDFGGFGSEFQQAPSAPASDDPFGTGTPDVFSAPIATVSPKAAATPAEEYSTGTLVALVAALVMMLPAGLMLLDTIVRMWSWTEPFVLNSILMDTISGLFGL